MAARTEPPGRIPWTALDIAAIIGLVILALIFAIVLIDAVLLAFAPKEADAPSLTDSGFAVTLIMLIQWVITLAVPLTYFMIRGYHLTPAILGFRRTRLWRATGWLFVVLAATSFLQIVYGWLIQTLGGENQLPSDVPSQDVTTLYGAGAAAFILTFVAVALITPVVEELFFRGIIHRGLEQQIGFIPGGALSAFIFAMAHIDYRLFVPIFGLGFGLAFLVHKTGSIWPGIGCHFIINSLGVIAQFANLGNGE